MGRSEGHPVIRSPQQLRLHPALGELDWIDAMNELNEAARLKNQAVPDPILITTSGTILCGFGSWRLAVLEGRGEINCIEHSITEDESLHFILSHHGPRHGWNAFIRIRAALRLEPNLQQRAVDNMRAGGKFKGLANLPEAQHIDVRREIAHAANVSPRYVSNVKTILQTAHPRLIDALRDGTLTINRAIQWCRMAKAEQVEEFTRDIWERTANKVIRQTLSRSKQNKTTPDLNAVLEALHRQEEREPGSVLVRIGRGPRTVVLIGQDLLAGSDSQKTVGFA